MYATRLLDYIRGADVVAPVMKTSLSPAASVDLEILSEAELQQCLTAAEGQSESVSASLQSEGGWEVCEPNSTGGGTMRVEVRSLTGAAHLIDLPAGSNSLDLRRALDPDCKLDLNAQPAFFCDGVELGDDDLVPSDVKGLPTLIHAVNPPRPASEESVVTPEVHGASRPRPSPSKAGRSAVWGTVATFTVFGLLILFGVPSWFPSATPPGLALQTPPRENRGSPNSTEPSYWLAWGGAEHTSKKSCMEQADAGQKDTLKRALSRASRAAHGLNEPESLVAMRAKRPLLALALPKPAAVHAVEDAAAGPPPDLSYTEAIGNGSLAPTISMWKVISQSIREGGKKMAEVWKAPFVTGKELGRRATNFILSALHLFIMRLWQRLGRGRSKSA